MFFQLIVIQKTCDDAGVCIIADNGDIHCYILNINHSISWNTILLNGMYVLITLTTKPSSNIIIYF